MSALDGKYKPEKANPQFKVFDQLEIGPLWGFMHPKDGTCKIVKCWKVGTSGEDRRNIQYILRNDNANYTIYRQPAHRDHVPIWWNYCDNATRYYNPLNQRSTESVKGEMRKEADVDGLLYIGKPPPPGFKIQ